jgi:hypothetical protein
MMPASASVMVLGDGEFDGTDLLRTIGSYRGSFVARTAVSTVVWYQGNRRHCRDMPVQPDRPVIWHFAQVTKRRFGMVQVIAYWEAKEQKPLYLLTNIKNPSMTIRHYQPRATIETFFSDQKSRGFRIALSHLCDPERLSRLLIACCLAYIWMLYMGILAHRDGWVKRIHRGDRCDLSLFQLGLRLIAHFLDEKLPIPVRFLVLDIYNLGDVHNGEQIS